VLQVCLRTKDGEPVDDESGAATELACGGTSHGSGSSKDEFKATVRRKDLGLYSLKYIPKSGVMAEVWVHVGGKPIPSSPFRIEFAPGDPSADACVLTGQGLKAAKRGEVASFRIEAFDQWGNKLNRGGASFSATIVSPLDQQLVKIVDEQNGAYSCSYVVNSFGDYSLTVRLAGTSLPGMPRTVAVPGPSTAHCSVSGPGIAKPVSLRETFFDIHICDSSGSPFDINIVELRRFTPRGGKSPQLDEPKLLPVASTTSGSFASGAPRPAKVAKIMDKLALELAVRSQLLYQMIAEVDSDGDGLIASDELVALVKRLGVPTTTAEVQELILYFDDNGDGRVECVLLGIRRCMPIVFEGELRFAVTRRCAQRSRRLRRSTGSAAVRSTCLS
jgi:hypothetical protein